MDAAKALNVPPPVYPYTEIRTPQEIVRVAVRWRCAGVMMNWLRS
jgi:hypothetical protein